MIPIQTTETDLETKPIRTKYDMSSPDISVPLANGNATMKAPLAPSDETANVALSINTKSSYTSQPSLPTPDGPGLRPRDAYDSLPWWRAAIRNKLLESLDWQSTVLANMQVGGARTSFHNCELIDWYKGSRTHTMAGSILCVHLLSWHPHFLHDGITGMLFFRL